MIPTEIWVPNPDKPGMLSYAGQRSKRAVFEDVRDVLTQLPQQGDSKYSLLDAFEWLRLREPNHGQSACYDPMFPHRATVACYVTSGSNEGYIVSVAAIQNLRRELFEQKCIPLADGKVLGSVDVALQAANAITRCFHEELFAERVLRTTAPVIVAVGGASC